MTNRIGVGRVGRIISKGQSKKLVPRSAIITVLPQPEGDLPNSVIANTRVISPVTNRKKERRKNDPKPANTLPPELKQFAYPMPKLKTTLPKLKPMPKQSIPQVKGKTKKLSTARSPTPLRLPRTSFSIKPRKEREKKKTPKQKLEESKVVTAEKLPSKILLRSKRAETFVTIGTQTKKRVIKSRGSNSTASASSRPLSESSSSVSVSTQTSKPKSKKKKIKRSPSLPSVSTAPMIIAPPILLPNEVEVFEEPDIDPDPEFPFEPPVLDHTWDVDPEVLKETRIDAASPSEIYEPNLPIGDMAPSVTDPIDVPRVLQGMEDDGFYEQPPEKPKGLEEQPDTQNTKIERETPIEPEPDAEKEPDPSEPGEKLQGDVKLAESSSEKSNEIPLKESTNLEHLESDTEPNHHPDTPKQDQDTKVDPDITSEPKSQPKNEPNKPRRNSAPNIRKTEPRNPGQHNNRPRPTSAKGRPKQWPKPKEVTKRQKQFTDPFFGKNGAQPKPINTGSKDLNKLLKDFFSG